MSRSGSLKRNIAMTAWTAARIARLKALWKEGRTAAAISLDLGAGISRSAVLGKVHRMGLSSDRKAPSAPATPSERQQQRPASQKVRPIRPPQDRNTAGKSARPPAAPPLRGTRTILTVGRTDCRWPLGDPHRPGFSLCGCPVSRGAYCEAHASMAYSGATRTLEGLARWAGVA